LYDEVMAARRSEIDFTGDEEDLNSKTSKASEDAPVVRLVNMMLLNAIKKGRATSTSSRTRRSSASGIASTASSARDDPAAQASNAIASR